MLVGVFMKAMKIKELKELIGDLPDDAQIFTHRNMRVTQEDHDYFPNSETGSYEKVVDTIWIEISKESVEKLLREVFTKANRLSKK